MAVRDFNWVGVPFGMFMAGIVVLASVTVAAVVLLAILDQELSSVFHMIAASAAIGLVIGMLAMIKLYPGPGRIFESPLLALALFMSVPLLMGALSALGFFGGVSWYFPVFYGLTLSLLMGFVVIFVIVTEARDALYPRRAEWPLRRPAGSQGGLYAIPRAEVKVYAGLERGGTEEQRPDTFVRMKTRR